MNTLSNIPNFSPITLEKSDCRLIVTPPPTAIIITRIIDCISNSPFASFRA